LRLEAERTFGHVHQHGAGAAEVETWWIAHRNRVYGLPALSYPAPTTAPTAARHSLRCNGEKTRKENQ
jgi:hypothetical protein